MCKTEERQETLWSHSKAAAADNSGEFQNLCRSSMIAMVVLCPKMKAPTTTVMIPQTVKITLQMREAGDQLHQEKDEYRQQWGGKKTTLDNKLLGNNMNLLHNIN